LLCKADITKSKSTFYASNLNVGNSMMTNSTSTAEYSQSLASNLISKNNLNLTSTSGDLNITGSNISSTNGNLNLTAMLGNLNIKAGESSYSQEFKLNSKTLGGSYGNQGYSANIGFNEAESSTDQTTFTNSQITAENGNLNITTKKPLFAKEGGSIASAIETGDSATGNATITGANLLAKNINLKIDGNLTLKSKQNLLESDSYSFGTTFGINGGGKSESGINGGSTGFNIANGFQSRAWVDQLTSIIGTNSVNINVANNTNITGAMIANATPSSLVGEGWGEGLIDKGNLTLNTKSLTIEDLHNYNNSESSSFGLNLQLGKNSNSPTQNGSLNINLAMQGSESSSTTRATVGQGNININGITYPSPGITYPSPQPSPTRGEGVNPLSGLNRDINQTEQNKKSVITSDFDINLKLDTRLIAAAGNLAIGNRDKAAANWNSYATETTRGANITYDALAIPLNTATQTIFGDLAAKDALYTIGKNYNLLYNLAYNPNLTATDLAGEGKLISYNGEEINSSIGTKYANGFYNREDDTIAINHRENETISELAGTLAHEGVHRDFNLNSKTYSESEEASAHIAADFVQGRWNTYQQYNTTLKTSLPQITTSSNSYANGITRFDERINPYQKDVHFYLTRYLAENLGATKEQAQAMAEGNQGMDEYAHTSPMTIVGGERARELYHFTTPERREELKRIGYDSKDPKVFGNYLHAFQDSFSHQMNGVPYGAEHGHLDFSDPDGFGASVDRTYNRPELADQMAKQSYEEIEKFMIYTGRKPTGNWQGISSQVQQFNRIKIEDENEKGKILFR